MAELRRLLQALDATPQQRAQRLHWSAWRRAHQAAAQRGHVARRSRRTPPPAVALVAPVIVVPGTPMLTDVLWDRLRPLLPVPAPRGRPQAEARPLLAGLLWLMHTGASWRAIPAAYGPWPTVHSRYQRWRRTGAWAGIAAVLCDEAGPSAPAQR